MHEKAELEKKQADAAKKAKEKEELERLNAEKDAKLAAADKRAASGLHTFDPDEVDVHSSKATADDFLDAFGVDPDGVYRRLGRRALDAGCRRQGTGRGEQARGEGGRGLGRG